MPVATAIKREVARRLGRQWSAGERLPAVPALARMLGTGQSNTHRALRELVEEGYLIATPGQGTFVNRDFDESRLRAQMAEAGADDMAPVGGPASGKRVQVVAAAPDPMNHTGRCIEAARRMLLESGADVRFSDDAQKDMTDVSHLDVDGVLLLEHHLWGRYRFGSRQVAGIIRAGENVTVAVSGRYDVIGADSEQGGQVAGEHLRELGHKRAAFLGRQSTSGPASVFDETSSARLAGFEIGFGAAVDPAHYLLSSRYDDSHAARLLPNYLAMPDRPRAVFAASDDLALGFIVGAAAHGLNVGRDYHIVGFDGQQRGRTVTDGPLTTIEPPHEEIGRRAAAMLISRLLDPDQPVRKVSLGCRLSEGATVRRERSTS